MIKNNRKLTEHITIESKSICYPLCCLIFEVITIYKTLSFYGHIKKIICPFKNNMSFYGHITNFMDINKTPIIPI